jgi:acyl carrier protein
MSPSYESVLAIIGEEAQLDPSDLQPSATLASLDIASLDLMSILFTIEDRFGVAIDVQEMAGIETLDQFVKHVLSRLNAPA